VASNKAADDVVPQAERFGANYLDGEVQIADLSKRPSNSISKATSSMPELYSRSARSRRSLQAQARYGVLMDIEYVFDGGVHNELDLWVFTGMIFEARKVSLRRTKVTRRPKRMRKLASSPAESLPPTTMISFSRQEKPSQVVQEPMPLEDGAGCSFDGPRRRRELYHQRFRTAHQFRRARLKIYAG